MSEKNFRVYFISTYNHLDSYNLIFSANWVGREDNLYISGFHSVLSTASYFAQIIGYDGVAIGAIKEQFDRIAQLENILNSFSSLHRSPINKTFPKI